MLLDCKTFDDFSEAIDKIETIEELKTLNEQYQIFLGRVFENYQKIIYDISQLELEREKIEKEHPFVNVYVIDLKGRIAAKIGKIILDDQQSNAAREAHERSAAQ